MDINIRKAAAADIKDMERILSYYFLDIDKAGMNHQQSIVAVLDGKTVGCACLDIGDIVELRSIAVLPGFRNNGIGSKLVDYLIEHPGLTDAIYLRTMTPGFFEKKGFKKLPYEKKIIIWKDCAQCDRFNICRQILMKIMLL